MQQCNKLYKYNFIIVASFSSSLVLAWQVDIQIKPTCMNVFHRNRFFFHLEPNHKPTLCLKHEEINARKPGLWDMNAYFTTIFVAVLKREYRRLSKIADLDRVFGMLSLFICEIYGFECAFLESKTSLCNVTACEEYIF